MKKNIVLGILAACALTMGAQVKPGVEVLRDNNFEGLRGKRVGLITNPSGVDNQLKSTVDILAEAPGVKLVALYAPEHGVRGDFHAGDKVENAVDSATGIPVYSIYGKYRKPSPEMLKDIDVMVYDIQDNGCRSFTFISTMGLAMEACAELGKEFMVFVERIEKQLAMLHDIAVPAKFGGATGNFNAHRAAYPQYDWVAFANRFVGETLGLCRSQYTTQIEHYDNLAAIFDNMKRIDTILIDLCRDMWTYISMEYFKQQIKAGEVGSSAMPHKVNPIDFENAEGNFGIANALFEHLSSKLPVSRLQRDLTDSTVLRNIGVPVAHAAIALRSLMKGLNKVILNRETLDRDLENNWAVVAEGIQTILRREGYPKPYEALKALTRTNAHITHESIAAFIETLDVAETVKEELRALAPSTYTGVFR